MTNAETRDYSALESRELDALVAERVMGQSVTLIGSHPHYMDDSTVYRAVRHYSTTWGGAGLVLEAMRERGWSWQAMAGPTDSDEDLPLVFFSHRFNAEVESQYAHECSMPRAVCIAALRAIEAGA